MNYIFEKFVYEHPYKMCILIEKNEGKILMCFTRIHWPVIIFQLKNHMQPNVFLGIYGYKLSADAEIKTIRILRLKSNLLDDGAACYLNWIFNAI